MWQRENHALAGLDLLDRALFRSGRRGCALDDRGDRRLVWTLRRPSFAPPNRIFGPVWSLLYTLMAVAAWRVWLATPSPARSSALSLFLAQLALNLAWSWIFFRSHAIGAALAEVIVLWVAIGATVFAFAPLSSAAAWLMAPYCAWVTFAMVLNAGFWRLNRTA